MLDACIVGGGPAGAAAAVTLCRAGCRVAIAAAPPHRRHGGGETLAPAAADVLRGLSDGASLESFALAPVTSYASTWGSADRAVRPGLVSPLGSGLHVDRGMLDAWLLAAAARAGARILGRARACRDGRQGWTIDCEPATTVQASILIAATGREANKVGVRAPWLHAAPLLACTVAVETPRTADDRSVRIDAVEEGWVYSVQPPGRPRTVSLFTAAATLREANRPVGDVIARAVRQAPNVADVLEGVVLPPPVSVASAAVALRARACGDRFTACGDAAQTLDPLSSHGILAALQDGAAAAAFVLDYGPGAARAREQEHRRRFLEHLRMRASYYSAESRWPHAPFWALHSGPRAVAAFVARYAGAR